MKGQVFKKFFGKASKSIDRNVRAISQICSSTIAAKTNERNKSLARTLENMTKLATAAFEGGDLTSAVEEFYFAFESRERDEFGPESLSAGYHDFSQVFLAVFEKAFEKEIRKDVFQEKNLQSDEDLIEELPGAIVVNLGDESTVEDDSTKNFLEKETIVKVEPVPGGVPVDGGNLVDDQPPHEVPVNDCAVPSPGPALSTDAEHDRNKNQSIKSSGDAAEGANEVQAMQEHGNETVDKNLTDVPSATVKEEPEVQEDGQHGEIAEDGEEMEATRTEAAKDQNVEAMDVTAHDGQENTLMPEMAVAGGAEEARDIDELIVDNQPEATETPKMPNRRSTRLRRLPLAPSLCLSPSDGETSAEEEQPDEEFREKEEKERKKRGPKVKGLAHKPTSDDESTKTTGRGGRKDRIPSAEEEFPCSTCGKTYPTGRSLYLHARRMHVKNSSMYKFMHGEQGKRVKCPDCGLEFDTKKRMCDHRGKVHKTYSAVYRYFYGESGKRYSCEQCTKSFSSPRSLYVHRNRYHNQHSVTYRHHVGVKGERYVCDVCKKEYSAPYRVLSHKRRMHNQKSGFNARKATTNTNKEDAAAKAATIATTASKNKMEEEKNVQAKTA